jgi:hypothetical protein
MKEVIKPTPDALAAEEARVLALWARMAMADRAAALNFMEASARQPAAPVLRLVRGGKHAKA